MTAESCTGGLLAAYITSIAGASDVLERGFVTYSNDAKVEVLSVEAGVISAAGAVSQQVALAMAAGALLHSRADISAAVTGVAGPGGGSDDKPVGLVHFAVAKRGAMTAGRMDYRAIHHKEEFGDIGRNVVQEEFGRGGAAAARAGGGSVARCQVSGGWTSTLFVPHNPPVYAVRSEAVSTLP